MNLNDYQKCACKTSAIKPSQENFRKHITMAVLGLNGEAGELADLIKKWLYHGHSLNIAKLQEELGDILWYIAEACTAYGCELEDIAESNLAKLQQRYGDKFSSEKSINRVE